MTVLTEPAGIEPIRTDRLGIASRWVSVVSHLDARFGGLSAVVPRLALEVTAATAIEMRLEAFCVADEQWSESDYPGLRITSWPNSRMAWWRQPALQTNFRKHLQDADGLHIHGLWQKSTEVAVDAARSMKKPYVLSAHGMLDRWALRNKGFKKSVYAALVERRNVRDAACLHALTLAEAQDYRRFGAGQPIAVIPNGVSTPDTVDREAIFLKFPSLRHKRMVLFLGRIHFKKGLDLLIEAWSTIVTRWPEAVLVLAGPDFEGTRARIEALVEERKLTETVVFTGMLRDELKWSALHAAECFILPSYSEGLSVSTLEAMAAGLPVIVTEQCNLPEVAEYGAGWVIKPAVEQVASALQDCLGNSQVANRQAGDRGRALIQQKFTWPSVARQMGEVYRWLQGDKFPESVQILRP